MEAYKTWYNFKIHFGASYQQHRKIRRETAASSGYANDYVIKPGEDLNEAPKEFANLASATAADRGVVATLTEANACLANKLKYQANFIKEITALLKKYRRERSGNGDCAPHRYFTPSLENYCWYHGYNITRTHTSLSCIYTKQAH